jgi:hypothetical protein
MQQPVATPPDSDDEDMLASLATPTRDALPNFAAAALDVLPDIPCKYPRGVLYLCCGPARAACWGCVLYPAASMHCASTAPFMHFQCLEATVLQILNFRTSLSSTQQCPKHKHLRPLHPLSVCPCS